MLIRIDFFLRSQSEFQLWLPAESCDLSKTGRKPPPKMKKNENQEVKDRRVKLPLTWA